MSYRSSEFLQDLQVELEEEAESQRAAELHFPPRSRRREDQLVQEDVVGPAEGLLIPRPEGNTLRVGFWFVIVAYTEQREAGGQVEGKNAGQEPPGGRTQTIGET